MSDQQTKFINFKLSSDNPKEKELIDWLEDRPLKYTFIEALTMYKEKYEAMVQHAKQTPSPQVVQPVVSPVPPEQEIEKPVTSNKFLNNLGQN